MFTGKHALLALVMLTTCADATAELVANVDREGRWQIYFSPNYVASKSLSFQDNTKLDLNDRTGWSFGIGYNFTNYVSADMTFSSGSGSYTVKSVDSNGDPVKYSNTMYSSSIALGVPYNIVDGPLTPYISGNIGSTFIDSGIVDSTVTGCWYDPWYGTVCGPITTTKTTTEFSYGGSIGVRYDFHNRLFIRGDVGLNVINLDSNDWADFTVYQLSIGSTF